MPEKCQHCDALAGHCHWCVVEMSVLGKIAMYICLLKKSTFYNLFCLTMNFPKEYFILVKQSPELSETLVTLVGVVYYVFRGGQRGQSSTMAAAGDDTTSKNVVSKS